MSKRTPFIRRHPIGVLAVSLTATVVVFFGVFHGGLSALAQNMMGATCTVTGLNVWQPSYVPALGEGPLSATVSDACSGKIYLLSTTGEASERLEQGGRIQNQYFSVQLIGNKMEVFYLLDFPGLDAKIIIAGKTYWVIGSRPTSPSTREYCCYSLGSECMEMTDFENVHCLELAYENDTAGASYIVRGGKAEQAVQTSCTNNCLQLRQWCVPNQGTDADGYPTGACLPQYADPGDNPDAILLPLDAPRCDSIVGNNCQLPQPTFYCDPDRSPDPPNVDNNDSGACREGVPSNAGIIGMEYDTGYLDYGWCNSTCPYWFMVFDPQAGNPYRAICTNKPLPFPSYIYSTACYSEVNEVGELPGGGYLQYDDIPQYGPSVLPTFCGTLGNSLNDSKQAFRDIVASAESMSSDDAVKNQYIAEQLWGRLVPVNTDFEDGSFQNEMACDPGEWDPQAVLREGNRRRGSAPPGGAPGTSQQPPLENPIYIPSELEAPISLP